MVTILILVCFILHTDAHKSIWIQYFKMASFSKISEELSLEAYTKVNTFYIMHSIHISHTDIQSVLKVLLETLGLDSSLQNKKISI